MKNKSFKLIVSIAIVVCVFGIFNFVSAENADPTITQALKNANTAIDKFPGDMPKSDDISGYAGKALYQVLGIIGTVALLIFLYGGIMWMLAGGKSDQIDTAKNTMIWASIGLFAIFMSYAIIQYLVKNLVFQ